LDISNGRLINNKYRGKKSHHPVFENRILQQGVKAKLNSPSYQLQQQQQQGSLLDNAQQQEKKNPVEIVKVREIKAPEPEMPEKRLSQEDQSRFLPSSSGRSITPHHPSGMQNGNGLHAHPPSRPRSRSPRPTPIQQKKMSAQGGSWQKDAADQNFDYMFKLLIIGNSSVGKTSFLFRYADDSFTSAFVSTVGIDFKVKTVFRQDKRVKLQIWDTAGQERYRTITTAYYRGAMGFILMYDVTNEESFSSVHDWCTQIKTYSWDNAQVILVGNKCDMEDERVISFERGKQLADSLGLEFFETSAKENINVRAVFERLVDIICDKMSESLDSDPSMNTNKVRVDNAPSSNVNCNC